MDTKCRLCYSYKWHSSLNVWSCWWVSGSRLIYWNDGRVPAEARSKGFRGPRKQGRKEPRNACIWALLLDFASSNEYEGTKGLTPGPKQSMEEWATFLFLGMSDIHGVLESRLITGPRMSGTPSISNSPISAMPSVYPDHINCQHDVSSFLWLMLLSAVALPLVRLEHRKEMSSTVANEIVSLTVEEVGFQLSPLHYAGQFLAGNGSQISHQPQPTRSKFDKGAELYAGLVLNMFCEEWSSSADKGGIALFGRGRRISHFQRTSRHCLYLGCVLQLGYVYAQSPVSRRHWRWFESHLAKTNDTAPMWQCTGLDLESRIQQHTQPVS